MDEGFTPYIAVVVDQHTLVPAGFVKDGQIVLNIGPMASNQLQISNDLVTFQARFSGKVQHLSVPVTNVAAIYARENGEGMGFEVELAGTKPAGEDGAPLPDSPADEPPPEPPRPRLTRVK